MEQRSRILVPVQYAAWLSGDLGRRLHKDLLHGLGAVPDARVVRVAGGFLVDADEEPGPLLEAVWRTLGDLDDGMARAYPMLRHELGSLWPRTLQVVFPEGPSRRAA